MKKSTSKMVGGGKAATDKGNGKTNGSANGKTENIIQVMIFENPEFGKIRIVTDRNGEPLFCGKDVCEVLGYRRADNTVRQHVNPHDALKQCIRVATGKRADGSIAERLMSMLFVTESGFYALVLGSKLESAQRFKLWVTSVVLPQIRKTGGYIPIKEGDTEEDIRLRAEQVLSETIRQKDLLIAQQEKLLGEQVARIEQLNQQVDEQTVKIQKSAEEIVDLEHDIDRLLPKALYADNVLDSISCYTTTQVAKELGCTAQELNRLLCTLHIQYYQSGQYMLYADFAHMGLAKSRTKCGKTLLEVDEECFKAGHIYTYTYLVWTERGRKFIHQLAKKNLDLLKINKV